MSDYNGIKQQLETSAVDTVNSSNGQLYQSHLVLVAAQ